MSLRATAGRPLTLGADPQGNPTRAGDTCGNVSTMTSAANIRIRCLPPVFTRLVNHQPVTRADLPP